MPLRKFPSNALDVLSLPPGELFAGILRLKLPPETILAASKLVVQNNALHGLSTQAEVVVRAGKCGFGAGPDGYRAEPQEQPTPAAATKVYLDLKDPEDVLCLPVGQLFLEIGGLPRFEIPIHPSEVVAAAEYLQLNGRGQELLSQAGAMVRAGELLYGPMANNLRI